MYICTDQLQRWQFDTNTTFIDQVSPVAYYHKQIYLMQIFKQSRYWVDANIHQGHTVVVVSCTLYGDSVDCVYPRHHVKQVDKH